MKPVNFKEANVVFGEGQKDYIPLPAYKEEGAKGKIVTKWKLTEEEIKKVVETGEIYLSILTFNKPLQPVLLTTEFKQTKK